MTKELPRKETKLTNELNGYSFFKTFVAFTRLRDRAPVQLSRPLWMHWHLSFYASNEFPSELWKCMWWYHNQLTVVPFVFNLFSNIFVVCPDQTCTVTSNSVIMLQRCKLQTEKHEFKLAKSIPWSQFNNFKFR